MNRIVKLLVCAALLVLICGVGWIMDTYWDALAIDEWALMIGYGMIGAVYFLAFAWTISVIIKILE